MKNYKSLILFFTSFIFFMIIILTIGNAKSENSLTDPELSNIYLKLSKIIDNTKSDIDQSISAIKSGDDTIALNILNNVTLNLEELYNGFDVLINEPKTCQN